MNSLLNPTTGARLESFTTANAKFPRIWEKLDLSLLLLGVKLATTWIVFSGERATLLPAKDVNDAIISKTVIFLESLGLVAEATSPDVVKDSSPPKPYRTRVVILIARDMEGLKLNRRLWSERKRNNDSEASGLGGYPDDDALYGRLAGFPDTAIKAYLSGNSLRNKDLPANVRITPAAAFAVFKFSPDHLEQELTLAAEWAAEVEQNAPKLNAEIMMQWLEMNR